MQNLTEPLTALIARRVCVCVCVCVSYVILFGFDSFKKGGFPRNVD